MPVRPPDDDLEDLEDEEEEEEEEEQESVPAPPEPTPPTPPAAAPAGRIPAHPQKRRRKRAATGVAGAPSVVEGLSWKNREADLMWGEMLQKLQATNHSPWEIGIAVLSLNGSLIGDGRSGGAMKLGSFEGSSVMGDQAMSPGDALVRKVEDSFHLPSGNQGPGLFEIQFFWKTNSQIYGRGRLQLPPRQQIMAMREQQMREQQSPQWGPPPQGFGAPMQQRGGWQGPYYQQPPMMPPYGHGYPPPYGYAPPQSQQPQGVDPSIKQMLEMLVAQNNELARQNAELRNQPPPAPMPVPQMPVAQQPAAAQPSTEELVERGVAKALAVLTGGRIGIGAPQQQPSQGSAMEAQLHKATADMMGNLLTKTLGLVAKGIERSVSAGLGAPQLPEEQPESELVEPPKPEDSLPFSAIELESTWHDGRKVTYPVKKDTGEVDWLAVLFTNPFLAEKMADGVNNVMGAVSDAVKKVGVGGPHIVSRVPSAAQDANDTPSQTQEGRTGFGSGWGEE
jgi:hypothetical protein